MNRGHHATALLALFLPLLTAAGCVLVHAEQDAAGDVKPFTIIAKRFAFEPNRIEVTEGDKVRLVVRSVDGTHGFAIRKYKVESDVPKGGGSVTVEFTADKVGSFPFVCSNYCGKGHADMKGVLVVKPRQ